MNFAIGIPTINRADLLAESILDLQANCPNVELFIVDNGHQNLRPMLETSGLNVTLFENASNHGVAGSWNQIASSAFARGFDWVWIANDDVVLGKRERDIEQFCSQAPKLLHIFDGSWCSFLLPRQVWAQVGEFDTQFWPAYYEDNDYAERIFACGLSIPKIELLRPTVFRNSQTIAKDPSLNDHFAKNRERFAAKYGVEVLFRWDSER